MNRRSSANITGRASVRQSSAHHQRPVEPIKQALILDDRPAPSFEQFDGSIDRSIASTSLAPCAHTIIQDPGAHRIKINNVVKTQTASMILASLSSLGVNTNAPSSTCPALAAFSSPTLDLALERAPFLCFLGLSASGHQVNSWTCRLNGFRARYRTI